MSKILIVEDEVSIAELEKDYLELSGFEVEIEHDGHNGLKRALEEDFDLFILDLMLPEVDGFEICKKIRETKNTPIIIATISFGSIGIEFRCSCCCKTGSFTCDVNGSAIFGFCCSGFLSVASYCWLCHCNLSTCYINSTSVVRSIIINNGY